MSHETMYKNLCDALAVSAEPADHNATCVAAERLCALASMEAQRAEIMAELEEEVELLRAVVEEARRFVFQPDFANDAEGKPGCLCRFCGARVSGRIVEDHKESCALAALDALDAVKKT